MSVQRYLNASLAPSSQKAYRAGIGSFLKLCTHLGSPPLPVTQDLLCSFVAYLANTNCAYQTIRSYLAAVRYLQIANNLTPTPLASMHKLQLVMRGARRHVASSRTVKPRLPITPEILRKLRALWSGRAHEFDVILLWAACCSAFFVFFPRRRNHDPVNRQLRRSPSPGIRGYSHGLCTVTPPNSHPP